MWQPVKLLKTLGILGMMAVVALFSGLLTMKLFLVGGDVTVPELVGNDLREAGSLLKERDLRLRVEEQYHPQVPKGYIISQKPTVNTMMKKTREVKVVVSLGQREVLVPDMVGRKVIQAEIVLQEKGFLGSEIVKVFSMQHPSGVVIAQSPSSFKRVWSGATVKLLVSQGLPREGYYLMDFSGKTLEEAKRLIQNLGLSLGDVRQEPSPSALAGVVLRQVPPSGSKVVVGNTVSFVVSLGAGAAATAREGVLAPFRYVLPKAGGARMVRIVVENEAGRKDIFRQERKAGEEVRLLVSLMGETAVQVYLDDELVEERVIKP